MSELPRQHPKRDEFDNVENELTIFLIDDGVALITELRYVGTVRATIEIVDGLCVIEKELQILFKIKM